MVRKGFIKLVLTSFLLVLAMVCSGVQARELTATSVADTTIALSQLPPQGIEIYRLIHQGGPFPFGKDGVIFGNRERLLPAENGATTANTPSKHRDQATGEPVGSCVEALPPHPTPVFTRPITMRVFAKLCHESNL